MFMAFIWSAKNLALQAYWRVFKFAHSSTQIIYLLLYTYLIEGCYFGAIMGSAKIAKIKYFKKYQLYSNLGNIY